MKLALAIALCACTGQEGTVSVGLVTAPGSTLMDGVEKLRLTVTSPHQVVEADRNGGFDLAIDLPADGGNGALIIEGFDASSNLIATGQSPPFSVAGINAKIAVYMAPPRSIGAAPLDLTPVRSRLSAGSLSYGVVIAGGADAAGLPTDAIAIYNAYDHSFTAGLPLLAPRSGVTLVTDATGHVVLFGGTGVDGQPTDTLWSFDTNVAPTGAYIDLGEQAGFARTGQLGLVSGTAQFIVSGTPVVEFSSTATPPLTARTDIASLPAVGTSLTTPDHVVTAVFGGLGAGTGGFARFRQDVLDQPTGDAQRQGGVVASLPNGFAVLVGGDDSNGAGPFSHDLLVLDATTGAAVPSQTQLQTARFSPGAAATSRYLVVAGGAAEDGTPVGSVEVFDAFTLAPIIVLPLVVPRTTPTVVALPNDQVLIAGGLDASGQPIATMELFTPEPPADAQ